jgi:hypothetical protein
MTSLQKLLGRTIDMTEVTARLEAAFRLEFAEYRWTDELRGLEVAYENTLEQSLQHPSEHSLTEIQVPA